MSNPNRELSLDKVVVHMSVGESGEKLVSGENILQEITGLTPIRSFAKQTIPAFGLRKGAPMGCKVTLRSDAAEKFLETTLAIIEKRLTQRHFDKQGNFSFGVEEHTDFPGQSYDPKIGIFGFDVIVVLKRNGYRISRRKIQQKKLPSKQRITPEDAISFVTSRYGVEVV
ncbi:MAG: 50S ribosomal protein L5 [Euryarchaeota archaeon]|nr:50S ribosomal protein L5 [Euryarchaeota archaeon]